MRMTCASASIRVLPLTLRRIVYLTQFSFFVLYHRNGSSDPEDLWDFGTVRHAGTVGRAAPNPVHVSGPPLTWENNGTGTTRSDDSSDSSSTFTAQRRGASDTSSLATTINAKGDLPPIPAGANANASSKKYDQQATIRHGVGNSGLAREPSDEDDYGAEYVGQNHRSELDDELPDTTMLDSVVLPAIASVSLSCLVLLRWRVIWDSADGNLRLYRFSLPSLI